MIDLKKTTIIIPVKIEHEDRYRNAKCVLNFLNSNLETNVFIYEISDTGTTKMDFISDLDNINIKHWIFPDDGIFHRTKYLNFMLDLVETPVVVNYDIDIILDPDNMLECQNLILEGKSVIYPYQLGEGQIQVQTSFDYEGFIGSNYSMEFINQAEQINKSQAECGHCIFFDTSMYRNLGGENENFISYGPEDKERLYRFQILSNSVSWRSNHFVYHFEHYRGSDSCGINPMFYHNWEILNMLKQLSPRSLYDYYLESEYSKKYKNIGKSGRELKYHGTITCDIERIITPSNIGNNPEIINQTIGIRSSDDPTRIP